MNLDKSLFSGESAKSGRTLAANGLELENSEFFPEYLNFKGFATGKTLCLGILLYNLDLRIG